MCAPSILISLFEKSYTRLCLFILLIAFLFLQTASFANDDESDPNLFTNKAPVIIDGYTLFTVHGISSHPAEERAKVRINIFFYENPFRNLSIT